MVKTKRRRTIKGGSKRKRSSNSNHKISRRRIHKKVKQEEKEITLLTETIYIAKENSSYTKRPLRIFRLNSPYKKLWKTNHIVYFQSSGTSNTLSHGGTWFPTPRIVEENLEPLEKKTKYPIVKGHIIKMGQTIKLKFQLTNSIYQLLIRYFKHISGRENVEELMMENPPTKETEDVLRENCSKWYGEHFNNTIDMLDKYFTEEVQVYISFLQGGGYWEVESHRPFTYFIKKEVDTLGLNIGRGSSLDKTTTNEEEDNTEDIIKWAKENQAQFTRSQMEEYRDTLLIENEPYQLPSIVKSRERITLFYSVQCPIYKRQNEAVKKIKYPKSNL